MSALLASGALGQVVNFHDAANDQLSFPGVGYEELFAGQGAYSDPGNDIWNGFGQYAGYGSTYFYSGSSGTGGPFPQQAGNPGNPYANYGGTISTGSSLFVFSGSPTTCGNATSGGQFTPITLKVGGYAGDNGIGNIGAFFVPNGTASFLLGEAAVANGATPNEVFTLQNVPAGTYGLYLYAANEGNNRGTAFSVNTGTAHNGIAATLNGQNGSPAAAFVEGQNFVIFENVTPDGSGNITITASPNSQDGVGNSNLAGETDVNGFQLIFNPPPTALGSTAAQNVYAGGSASFLFTAAFATSPTFQWQFIKSGVTNNLTDGVNVTGATTTNLTLANVSTSNIGLYQCVISTASATNTSPAAPLTLLTSPAASPLQNGEPTNFVGYVLQPGDVLSDFNNNVAAPYNSIPAPFDMSVTNVEDGTLFQYVNFGGNGSTAPFSGPVGFTVTPQFGATVVTGIRFFTSSSHPEDDPADYLLQGSDDGGATFTTIAGGLLALPAQRNAASGPINDTNQILQEIVFPNTISYTTYQLTFTNVDDDTIASNGVQIAEVQLLGSLPAGGPGIVTPPSATETLLAGATFHPTIIVSGPGPLTYQWSLNSQAIANATNATYTLANVQTADSGTYSVVVNNPYGSTNATTILSIVAPTPYQQRLLALNPLGYWPLNETSGTIAYDNIGGYNGTYIGSDFTLAQPGVPYEGFGSPSYCTLLNSSAGGSYVDVPEGPFSITTPITIIGWIQLNEGGNPFEDILGHGDNSYRITVNGSQDPGFACGDDSGDATSATSILDGNWHMIAGTYVGGSGATANGFLYVDGSLVASNEITSVPANGNDVWLGGAPDYGTGRLLLDANLAHLAIIPQGLSSAQIQTLYFGSEPSPIVTVPSTPIPVDEDADGSIVSSVVGAPPLDYEWFYVSGVTTNLIAGATNGTLTLTNVQVAQGSYSYFVVVSNSYGASTSSFATLNIASGAPTLVADINPLLVETPVGIPVTFFVTASGTEPFAYQWSNEGGVIVGATSSSYTFDALVGTNSYFVTVTNVDGSTPSSTAVVVGLTGAPPVISFNGNGANWTLNQGAGWPGSPSNPSITNDLLTLTDGTNGEAASAFFDIPQYIGGFIASFTYQEAPGTAPLADGITFCVQNSTNSTFGTGLNSVGNGGGDFGYNGIMPSAALELNIYSGDHGGTGYLIGTEGNTPGSDAALGDFLSLSPVNLTTGDPIQVALYYNQNVVTLSLADAKTGNTFTSTTSLPDLPAIVGAPSAFVGFTGATGGLNSIQTVSNFVFSYTTPPILSLVAGTAGSVVITWPVSVSTLFVLQQTTALNGTWSNVTVPPVVVNSQNQVTLTPGTSAAFYRLSLQ